MTNGATSKTWTPERDALLRSEWALAARVVDIAYKMNLTRNQVIGRAHRLRLPRHAHACEKGAKWSKATRRASIPCSARLRPSAGPTARNVARWFTSRR